MKQDLKRVEKLMQNPPQIRNICIISHIDHGKTSLADSFLAYAGIINPDEAGKKMALHQGAERERGITIDNSVVTFIYTK